MTGQTAPQLDEPEPDRHELELRLADERRAAAEAARAEQPAGEPEPDDEPDDEPDAEPPATGEPSPEEVEALALLAELDKAKDAYHRKVKKILGTEHVPPECEHCEGTGFDQSGGGGDLEYQASPTSEQCESCQGLGAVLTGSRIPDRRLEPCPRCGGAGYLEHEPERVTQPELVAPAIAAAARGQADGGELTNLRPGMPGWEPWMGGDRAAV